MSMPFLDLSAWLGDKTIQISNNNNNNNNNNNKNQQSLFRAQKSLQ